MSEPYNETVERISKLCDIILVNEDNLDLNLAEEYIREHIDNNIYLVSDNYTTRHIVQERIKQYIINCPSEIQLFIFDSDSGLHRYRKKFKQIYNKIYYKENEQRESLAYPTVFEDVFNCIQDTIDYHTLYKSFSINLENNIKERVIKKSEETAEKIAVNMVQKIVDDTVNHQEIKEKISNEVKDKIKSEMNDVTKNISETSVTILGIFAGIVLTVVAGLFYSSSVLNNINSANFCRLISVCALVGFVCYCLIALMFRYIERIKYKNDKMPKFNVLSVVVGATLILIMLVFGGLQYCDFNNYSEETIEEETITTSQDNEKGQED